MRLDSVGGWADRTESAVRSAYSAPQDVVFLGSCISQSGPFIDYVTDDARCVDMDYESFSVEVPLEGFKKALGYSLEEGDGDLDLAEDWHVTYSRSHLPPDHPQYPGKTVYFLCHSRIEYLWVSLKTPASGS